MFHLIHWEHANKLHRMHALPSITKQVHAKNWRRRRRSGRWRRRRRSWRRNCSRRCPISGIPISPRLLFALTLFVFSSLAYVVINFTSDIALRNYDRRSLSYYHERTKKMMKCHSLWTSFQFIYPKICTKYFIQSPSFFVHFYFYFALW